MFVELTDVKFMVVIYTSYGSSLCSYTEINHNHGQYNPPEHLEMKDRKFNPLRLDRISHTYKLDQSIFGLMQRRSHLFLVDAAETERRMRECKRRRREAILGGSRGKSPPPPPGNFLNKRCDFVYSGMILSSDFVSF